MGNNTNTLKYKTLIHKISGNFAVITAKEDVSIETTNLPVLLPEWFQMNELKRLTEIDLKEYKLITVELTK